MVMTACIDSDWRVLLVMPLHAKLLLLRQLAGIETDRHNHIKIIVFYLIVFTV